MTNKRQHITVASVIAFCSLYCLTGRAETKQEMRVASALFEQYETVAYTRTDFPPSSVANEAPFVDSLLNLKLPFEELLSVIHTLGPTAATALKNNYGAVLMGAKDFVPPKGIGAIGSHKCYVGVLRGDVQPNVQADFRNIPYELIDGRRVWTWSPPASDDNPNPPRYYAAQIANSYFVMTNYRQGFEQIAATLSSAENSGATSTPVFAWEAFSTHSYWMYRSLRRQGVVSPVAAGIKDLSSDVTALVFMADVDQRSGFLIVQSSDRAMKKVPSVFLDSQLNKLEPQGIGIWQATMPLSKDQAGFNTLFRVFYTFGFGAII